MSSIRARLIVVLIAATAAVWLSAVGWIYFSTRSEVEGVLDARLSEAARMVSSLVSSRDISVADAAGLLDGLATAPASTTIDRQLSCQLWSFDGALVGRSDGAPAAPLAPHEEGFADTVINGERWRVFAVSDAQTGIRVLVGDSLAVRERLVGDVITGLVVPAALVLPLMAGLIFLSVNRGLLPIDRVARELGTRRADEFAPIRSEGPREIRPMLDALNALFARAGRSRERERNFTAFAAHELRTPLTGLKTQAQIALRSDEPQVQRKALDQIVVGVDRTARMVSQLLAIAAIEAAPENAAPTLPDAGRALADLLSAMAIPPTVRVTAAEALDDVALAISATDFDLVMRNVLENAIAHSPEGGTVTIAFDREDGMGNITIADEGPGMAPEDLIRAKDRFFRGRNKTALGSGLGLSIAEAAALRAGGALVLDTIRPQGLQVCISLPIASP